VGLGAKTEKGLEKASTDSLLLSARMLLELPAIRPLEDAKVEVTKDKDTPEGTDTALPEAQEVKPEKEASEILKRPARS